MNFTQCVIEIDSWLTELRPTINLMPCFGWNFVSQAGVEAVSVFDGGSDCRFYPATVAAITGIVGKPDTVDGPDDVIIDFGVHFMGPE